MTRNETLRYAEVLVALGEYYDRGDPHIPAALYDEYVYFSDIGPAFGQRFSNLQEAAWYSYKGMVLVRMTIYPGLEVSEGL